MSPCTILDGITFMIPQWRLDAVSRDEEAFVNILGPALAATADRDVQADLCALLEELDDELFLRFVDDHALERALEIAPVGAAGLHVASCSACSSRFEQLLTGDVPLRGSTNEGLVARRFRIRVEQYDATCAIQQAILQDLSASTFMRLVALLVQSGILSPKEAITNQHALAGKVAHLVVIHHGPVRAM